MADDKPKKKDKKPELHPSVQKRFDKDVEVKKWYQEHFGKKGKRK